MVLSSLRIIPEPNHNYSVSDFRLGEVLPYDTPNFSAWYCSASYDHYDYGGLHHHNGDLGNSGEFLYPVCPNHPYPGTYPLGEPNPPKYCTGPTTPVRPPVCNEIGYPVEPASGVKVFRELDFRHSSNPHLYLERTYRSFFRIQPAGMVSWITNWHRRLFFQEIEKDVSVVSVDESGRSRYFYTSQLVPEHGLLDRLTKTSSGYQLFRADNTLEQYTSDGYLAGVYHHDGAYEIIRYVGGSAVGSWNVASITDHNGAAIKFNYDAVDRVSSVTTSDQRVINYLYFNYNGYPLSVVGWQDGKSRSYTYSVESPSSWMNILSVVDEDGALFSRVEYDRNNRVVYSGRGGDQSSYTFKYSEDKWFPTSTVVTDPSGVQRTYSSVLDKSQIFPTGVSKPGGAGCNASSSNIDYDTFGNAISRTDFNGMKSCHGYDASRNLETSRIEGFASSDACPADVLSSAPSSTQRKTTTQWHPFWRLETRQAEPKRVTTWVYNGQPDPTNGNALASCAPATAKLPDGQVIAVLCKRIEQATTDATGAQGFGASADGPARIWAYTYNAFGQVLTEDGPRTDLADVTKYVYYTDTTANWTQGDLRSITNALGHVWTFTQYDKAGRLLAATDPNGTALTYTYTPRGWLASRSVAGQTSTFAYTGWGGLALVTLPDGTSTSYTWDAAHRLTSVSDSAGNSTRFVLDPSGNITSSTTTDAAGNVARQTRTEFDALGRPWKHYDAAGHAFEVWHDAMDRVAKTIDPKGRTTTFARDTLGRLQDITDAQTTPGHTGFAFDARDQMTRQTAPNGAVTQLSVDGLGNTLQEVSANRGTLSFTYDAAGNLLTRTDARGVTANYTYDALNRIRKRITKNSAGVVTETLDYIWDGASGCTYGRGHLCQITDGGGVTNFAYDARGNRISERRSEAGRSYTTQYTLNGADRIVALVTPTGSLLDQARDAGGRVAALTATAGGSSIPVASAVRYDGAGNVVSLSQGTSLSQLMQRNADGQLEANGLGIPVTGLGLSLGKRFIRPGDGLDFTLTLTPAQASGTVFLCQLDCQGSNQLAVIPVTGGTTTGTLTGLTKGVHHLSAVLVPNPPYAASLSESRRVLVGVPPTLFFDDLFLQ